MIYFDSAATTFRKPHAVGQAMLRSMERCASPGRGGYRAAMEAAETVYACREQCAGLFDCAPEQVVFTFNATHGLNLAIKSMVGPGDRVVVSGFEHNAVMRPLTALGADVVIAGRTLFDPADTLENFQRALERPARAVVCTHVSNVFGYALPLAQIAMLCRERQVPLIVDASQSAGVLPLSLRRLQAAFIAMPGHKSLYGPQGTGVLLCGVMPKKTVLEGGTGSVSRELSMPEFLPDRLEAGTSNVTGIAGLGAGLQFVASQRPERLAAGESRLCRLLADGLAQMDGVRVFRGGNQVGVLSFQAAGMDCEEVARRLAAHDIAVRAGLQCAPCAHESAGTLEDGTIRVSFSAFSAEAEVRQFIQVMREINTTIKKETPH
ncbi:MAG: aminotransferase class V-fold PLP-dependent enzyme [Oscillospiraceae bacterium]|nr:aminotransferase class V-fold PLP-dependent enzyme [Oscillospiraceae bacterium]